MNARIRFAPMLAVGLLLLVAACAHPRAIGTAPAADRVGVLVMAHGGSAEWNRSVRDAVAPLESRLPVAIAFGMAKRSSLQEAMHQLEHRGVRRVAVVRLFVSAESFLHDTEYLFGLRSDPPARFAASAGSPSAPDDAGPPPPLDRQASVALSRTGLSDASPMGEIIAQRVSAQSTTPENETVLIVAHGVRDDRANDQLIAKLDRLADQVRAVGDFRSVTVATLREDWSAKRTTAEQDIRHAVQQGNEHGGRVIVVPFRLSGFGPYREVLAGLAYEADGLGLLPHPKVTTWIEQEAALVFTSAGWPNPLVQPTTP